MTAFGVDMTKTVDEEMARKLKEKLETELIPRLQNQKISLRTVVAVNVIAIVDRQIGEGEGSQEEEWDKLRGFVKDHPRALELVENLKVAIDKYDEEIRTKTRESELDEKAMRRAASGVMRSAIMAKLKSLQEADREEDAAAAAAPPPEEPAKT